MLFRIPRFSAVRTHSPAAVLRLGLGALAVVAALCGTGVDAQEL
ncbi:MAG: hypothetical protein JWM03_1080, partial [Rhodocyclales bacterium]|nr:hypothetical protein [Rhodocyclales bacterium]